LQLESHLLKKKVTPLSKEQNKTKWSDKDEDIEEGDSIVSPAKVILQEGSINSLVKYTNSRSTMKMKRKMSLRRFGSAIYATTEKTSEHLEFYEKTFNQLNAPPKLFRTNTHSKPNTKALKLNEL
jgi:hypothetical protein